MKKIYINEDSVVTLNKKRLLPKFLFKLIKSHMTSLGDSEAFPSGDEYPFDYTILKKRYGNVCDAIESLELPSLDEDYLMSTLSSLIKECKELEKPVRDALEKICENSVNRLFAIPSEMINLSCKLVDKITFKNTVRIRPESKEEIKYTFTDVNDIDLSNKAVEKRRFINALIQGASYLYSKDENLYKEDINKINPNLLPLYEKIIIINDYLLFIKKEELSDEKPMQGSYCETHVGNEGKKSIIESQGIIFPLLLQDTIRGFFDLFSTHGLPKNKEKAMYIIKKADFILAEPWDMRLGVELWKEMFGNIKDTNIIPYVFTEYVKHNEIEFNQITKEILSKTKKGYDILNSMINTATYDSGYEAFKNRINARNINKSVINDSYFTAAELDGFNLDGENQQDENVIEEDDVEEDSEEIETWYKGICGQFNEVLIKRQIWLADSPEFAAEYIEQSEDGHLYAFDVNISKFNEYNWRQEDNSFEPIDGFSEEEQKKLTQEGYNGYSFALDDGTVLVLFDPSLIVNVREIPLDEYIEESRRKDANLLTESQESKSIAAAKKLVMQRLQYNEQQADEFIRIKLRNDLPILRTPQGGKFILGVARMFCDGELRSANDIGNLNSTLKLIASDAHVNEYDRNLNGMSCQELIQRFSKAMSDNLEAEKAEIGQMVFDTPSDYEIVRIDSFKQASEYSKYTSWCVTHDKNMFDSYTSDGINQFYFCLRNGFENVEKQPSDGCPLDKYGLSMIAVSVNEDGMLNTCTCRWNHDNGGDDNVMNSKELSQVIGMNFFDVFRPNNKWKEVLSDAMQRLSNGESIEDVFYWCGDFYEGFAWVVLNGKFNFLTKEGKILSDQWFDWCDDFREGFATVKLNEKFNFINRDGKLLSDKWFNWCDDFREGFAAVKLDKKRNFLTKEGKILSDQWFDLCGNFIEGFAVVELNRKMNFITKEGRLLSNQWFDYCDSFHEGFARVILNGKYNILTKEGRLLSNQWFNWCDDFHRGFATAELNGRNYRIDTNGNLTR